MRLDQLRTEDRLLDCQIGDIGPSLQRGLKLNLMGSAPAAAGTGIVECVCDVIIKAGALPRQPSQRIHLWIGHATPDPLISASLDTL